MKYSIPVKFAAFLLAVITLVTALSCSLLAFILANYQLYDVPPEERQEQWYRHAGYPVAWQTVQKYAAQSAGECPQALVERIYGFSSSWDLTNYYVSIRLGDEVVYTAQSPIEGGFTCEFSMTPEYPKVVHISSAADPETHPTWGTEGEEASDPTVGEDLPTEAPIREEQVEIWDDGQRLIYELHYYTGPTYKVSVTMAPDALKDTFHSSLSMLYPHRYTLIWALALAFICTAALLVYLICAAGKTPDGRICPAGLNRLPLDLYLLVAALLSWFPLGLMIQVVDNMDSLSFVIAAVLVLCGVVVCLLALGWIFALSAQIKVGNGYWWRHSVLGALLRRTGIFVHSIFRLIPVIWQWLVTAFVMTVLTGGSFLLATSFRGRSYPMLQVLFVLCCVGCIGTICYGAYCFGTILSGAKRMSRGQFDHQIPTKNLLGAFRDCAEQLNALSGAARDAVQKQVRSERMKTELITNVSHDIKTPLTSIVNFVGLLQKPHTQEQQVQYLDVLSRQSQQLKKLIEDLLELSKASTGNMIVHITELDAVESVNQALGEFSDKLEKAGLTPIFHAPEEAVMIRADGRLVWRVLSNLLSNAVKYAAPGTRLYVDLAEQGGKVQLSVKNISREALTFSAEELMERFVQGDVSRNTDGSGLGLNIAKSLMEVQHGALTLLLDGDLFKVTLEFPGA